MSHTTSALRALLATAALGVTATMVTTTPAKVLRGRVLYVDSKFDEPVASGPYQVITDPTR